ncbi:hypothetical protein PENTCL1PPCAC_6980, partial [Pristionchus entomophagus]
QAHPLLVCGVRRTETRLANICRKAGATIPPDRIICFAVENDYGIDYRSIAEFDPFASDLYRHAWQGPKNLTTTTLPEMRNNQGDIIRQRTTGLRPNTLPRGGVFGHSFASASAKIELIFLKVGISPWMLAERMVRLSIRIRGVKSVSEAHISADGHVRSLNGERVSLEVVSTREEIPVEGWGEDLEIVLITPSTLSMEDPDKLSLGLTFYSDFVLCSIEIYAIFV